MPHTSRREVVEAVVLTSEEWERGNSFVRDYARNGEVLCTACPPCPLPSCPLRL